MKICFECFLDLYPGLHGVLEEYKRGIIMHQKVTNIYSGPVAFETKDCFFDRRGSNCKLSLKENETVFVFFVLLCSVPCLLVILCCSGHTDIGILREN